MTGRQVDRQTDRLDREKEEASSLEVKQRDHMTSSHSIGRDDDLGGGRDTVT